MFSPYVWKFSAFVSLINPITVLIHEHTVEKTTKCTTSKVAVLIILSHTSFLFFFIFHPIFCSFFRLQFDTLTAQMAEVLSLTPSLRPSLSDRWCWLMLVTRRSSEAPKLSCCTDVRHKTFFESNCTLLSEVSLINVGRVKQLKTPQRTTAQFKTPHKHDLINLPDKN